MYRLCFAILLVIESSVGWALAQPNCHPILWPTASAIRDPSFPIPKKTIHELQRYSNKLLSLPVNPIASLGSAGKTTLNDPILLASRQAFKDADRASVLALSYKITKNKAYLDKTKEILTGWARINKPTGNPIDETRLDGMIWAYDLIACDLTDQEKILILNWFQNIRNKKIAWIFGKKTSSNNHRIHQLKMLILLDSILNRQQDLQTDKQEAVHYSQINLNPLSGESIDYQERNALYYHNYVLQAWLEISLVTHCCHEPVNKAFEFLIDKIRTHAIGGEFSHSIAQIDALRGKNGFLYATKGGTFDITKAAPTIVMYYTPIKTNPDPKLWFIQSLAKPSPKMVFLKARRELWQP